MIVQKVGRTTGLTTGVVDCFGLNVPVLFRREMFMFHDQIMIRSFTGLPFAMDGDSGALIVDTQSKAAVGLLCAGSDDGFILASKIGTVLAKLQVRLVMSAQGM